MVFMHNACTNEVLLVTATVTAGTAPSLEVLLVTATVTVGTAPSLALMSQAFAVTSFLNGICCLCRNRHRPSGHYPRQQGQNLFATSAGTPENAGEP
jgi:hypothetical protein